MVLLIVTLWTASTVGAFNLIEGCGPELALGHLAGASFEHLDFLLLEKVNHRIDLGR